MTKKAKENFEKNLFHNILGLLIFYQIFFSPQLKRRAIITYKHGICQVPYKLPNESLCQRDFRRWASFAPTQEKKNLTTSCQTT